MADIKTSTKYKGDVSIKLKLKDGKVISLKKHNNGLPLLSKAFSLFMCNNINQSKYIPQYIDLQVLDGADWVSCLRTKIFISGLAYSYRARAYSYEQTTIVDDSEVTEVVTEGNWVTVANATIPYSSLIQPISSDDERSFRLYLTTGDIKGETTNRLCYVPIEASELSSIEQGTSMQVEWQLQLVHNVPITEEE